MMNITEGVWSVDTPESVGWSFTFHTVVELVQVHAFIGLQQYHAQILCWDSNRMKKSELSSPSN